LLKFINRAVFVIEVGTGFLSDPCIKYQKGRSRLSIFVFHVRNYSIYKRFKVFTTVKTMIHGVAMKLPEWFYWAA